MRPLRADCIWPKLGDEMSVVKLYRFKLQIIKEIERVRADLDCGIFADDPSMGKSEGLGERCIHVAISWPCKRVA